jgi:hypothetical protein
MEHGNARPAGNASAVSWLPDLFRHQDASTPFLPQDPRACDARTAKRPSGLRRRLRTLQTPEDSATYRSVSHQSEDSTDNGSAKPHTGCGFWHQLRHWHGRPAALWATLLDWPASTKRPSMDATKFLATCLLISPLCFWGTSMVAMKVCLSQQPALVARYTALWSCT